MKPSSISERCEVWVKNTVICCPQMPVTKMHSSLVILFLNYLNLCYFILPGLAQQSAQCISCLSKTQLKVLFINSKIVYDAGTQIPAYLWRNLFYVIYRISFSHNYRIEKDFWMILLKRSTDRTESWPYQSAAHAVWNLKICEKMSRVLVTYRLFRTNI
jgi:hypothetical protein